MRAIIVEDEFLAAIHAESALERLGIAVLGMAEDTQGALGLAAHKPTLALVDLNLRDGFTGPLIGAHLAAQGINVVYVTANPAQLEGVNPLRSPVLEKPLEEHKLASTLRSMFQQEQS